MTKQIIKISISQKDLDALLLAVHNAGGVVGRRETDRANVYLNTEGAFSLVTTFDQTMPSPYALLLASAIRITKDDDPCGENYLTTVNRLVNERTALQVQTEMVNGVASGITAYERVNKIEKNGGGL